jgi:two-component system sensor histidine kinase GlrK
MKFYRPHSFFTLLLTAFCLVALPLLTALYTSVQILDGLVAHSVSVVYGSVDRVISSRKVADLLQDEERIARMYQVLGETVQLEEVNKTHLDIETKLEQLASLKSAEQISQLLEEIKSRESSIVEALNEVADKPEQRKNDLEQVLAGYQDIGKLAAALISSSNQLMNKNVEGLQLIVDRDKNKLVWHTSALISFTVLVIILFIVLIFKPVKQIDKGIELLGDGNFTTPIMVQGPRDLEVLGNKLDWLRKRLASLDREKIMLVAHISHDLKTPLASIKEGAGLLRDELVGPMNDRQKEVVKILDKNCSRLQLLVEKILDFNMARAKNIPVEKIPVNLEELIAEAAADQRNSILARNIKLEMKLIPAVVLGNRKQLKTIFDNLLSNAVKFTPDRGIIRLHLKTKGKMAACLVEDSGPGVADDERHAIFFPFFQGKGVNKAVVKGSGLGLAISKEYAQNHGGTIRLLPSRQGAKFVVILPLSP